MFLISVPAGTFISKLKGDSASASGRVGVGVVVVGVVVVGVVVVGVPVSVVVVSVVLGSGVGSDVGVAVERVGPTTAAVISSLVT